MGGFVVGRAGVILAVAKVDRSLAFYRDVLGFSVDAVYDDPPYATLSRAARPSASGSVAASRSAKGR